MAELMKLIQFYQIAALGPVTHLACDKFDLSRLTWCRIQTARMNFISRAFVRPMLTGKSRAISLEETLQWQK